jgi:hypothetical protein
MSRPEQRLTSSADLICLSDTDLASDADLIAPDVSCHQSNGVHVAYMAEMWPLHHLAQYSVLSQYTHRMHAVRPPTARQSPVQRTRRTYMC